jgi:hypothetical protein
MATSATWYASKKPCGVWGSPLHHPIFFSWVTTLTVVNTGKSFSEALILISGVFSTGAMGAMAPVILRKRLIAPAVSTRNGKILLTLGTRNIKILNTPLFLHQLTHNMARDCLLNSPKNTSSQHVVYKNCSFVLTFKTIFVHKML